jgi:hypothetical protein
MEEAEGVVPHSFGAVHVSPPAVLVATTGAWEETSWKRTSEAARAVFMPPDFSSRRNGVAYSRGWRASPTSP